MTSDKLLARKVAYSVLSAYYGKLLTPHQQTLLTLYCDEDLSLTEIAAQLGISRQGVQDGISKAGERLEALEAQLGFQKRVTRMTSRISKAVELLENTPDGLQPAVALLRGVVNEEVKEHGV